MKYLSPKDQAQFYERVWQIVRQIPSGRVATYGQIAGYVQMPEGFDQQDYHAWSPRWVGGAMAACPDDVPWQRVINAQGKISLRGGGGGTRQRQLLEEEGVTFDDKDRIDLKRFSWRGPGNEAKDSSQLSLGLSSDGES